MKWISHWENQPNHQQFQVFIWFIYPIIKAISSKGFIVPVCVLQLDNAKHINISNITHAFFGKHRGFSRPEAFQLQLAQAPREAIDFQLQQLFRGHCCSYRPIKALLTIDTTIIQPSSIVQQRCTRSFGVCLFYFLGVSLVFKIHLNYLVMVLSDENCSLSGSAGGILCGV